MTTLRPARPRDTEWRISLKFDGSNWTVVSRDVLEAYGVQWSRGGRGGGPNDRVAETGILTFALNNSHVNSAGLLGHYSPAHLSARQGFDIGTPVQLEVAYLGHWRTLWVGRVSDIEPQHGVLGPRFVRVTAKDWMEEAAAHKLKGLETLGEVRADEVIEAIVAAMPIAPPGGTLLDEGRDVFPLAFDDVRDGKTSAMTEFAKLARSGLDYIFLTREGALRYQNRNTRNASPRNLFVLNGTMQDVAVRRSRDAIVNRIEVTVYPRAIDQAYAVLWSLQDQPFVAPGQTLTLRGDFTDPDNRSERIGAIDVQDTLVAGLDYAMDTVQDVAAGTADTPITLNPRGDGGGTYNSFTGFTASVRDNDNATSNSPTGGLVYQTYVFDAINAPDNAVVTGVKVVARIRHNSSEPYWTVWYPRLRLNGIDLDGQYFATTSFGLHDVTSQFDVPPGGASEWTVAAINALEAGGSFNWNGEVPELVKLHIELLYASNVLPTDRSDDFSVVVAASGNSATFDVTSDGDDGAYITKLQIRGRPIRINEPVTAVVEDEDSIESFGERSETVEMSYQPDVNIGTAACQYLLDQYSQAKDRPETVSLLANLSEDHMTAALEREIGDRVGLAEAVTGLSQFTAEGAPYGFHVVGVSGEIFPGNAIRMTWALAPADPNQYWHVEVQGQSEVAVSTTVGPL